MRSLSTLSWFLGARAWAWGALALGCLALGCPASPSPEVMCTESAVIYGEDSRLEPDQVTPEVRSLAVQAGVALVRPSNVIPETNGAVSLDPLSLQDRLGVCSTARFADQPAAAFCSGTLIDDDLVLTAGHCVKTEAACQGTRFIFNFRRLADGSMAPTTPEDFYGCRRLVTQRDEDSEGRRDDYAIVQLDRRATPAYRPLPIANASVSSGDGVVLFGHPDGLPMKIDIDGRVLTTRPDEGDYFRVAVDAFGGNSGSGLLNREGEVVGVLVRGGKDYRDDPVCGCKRPRGLQLGDTKGESASYVANPISALCDSGWPSQRLCGRAPECGDGICSAGEERGCSDCVARVCGDGVCDAGELEDCPADCTAPTDDNTPPEWTCGGGYGKGDGCDCNCNAYDPDCAGDRGTPSGCESGQLCNAQGECESPAPGEPPEGWTCPAIYQFAGRDGCDCNCGLYDPDCDDPSQTLFRCGDFQVCNDQGRCQDAPREVPSAWTCPDARYQDGETCHCACGAHDPDCDAVSVVEGCGSTERCEEGLCVGTGVPAGWLCANAFYDDRTRCDCDCGVPDPDCAPRQEGASNCNPGELCIDGTCAAMVSGWGCNPTYYNAGDGCDCGCGIRDPDCDTETELFDCSSGTCSPCADGATCAETGCVGGSATADFTFSGSVAMSQRALHAFRVDASATRFTVRLRPTGGDLDLYLGGTGVSLASYDESSRRSGETVDEIVLTDVSRTEWTALVWGFRAGSYTLEVFID